MIPAGQDRIAARAAQEGEARERRRRAGPITPAIRAAVVGRRRKCPGCGSVVGRGRLTLDHRKAVRFGGLTEPDNLATLCLACNASKGDGTRGPPRRCVGCRRTYRRARGGEDGLCNDCRQEARYAARARAEAALRKRASAWKRVLALRARRHLRAVRRG